MNWKLLLTLIFTIILLTINIYTVNAETIEKSNISVKLLDHTYYCDEKCYTKYEVCYDQINLNQDLTTKFKSDKNETLEPENYLERYEIEMGETQNCRKLTVHGKKGIFENIDNVICINDVCFDEFLWWNTSWLFRTEINFTNYIPDGFFFPFILVDNVFWVKKVSEQMYYYTRVDTSDITIGNETHQLYWENDSLALTGNYNKLIYDAIWCSHLHNGSIIDSCNLIHGSLVGSPTFQEGIYGNGSAIPSKNDAIDTNIGGGTFNVGSNYSASLWFKKINTIVGYSNIWGSSGDTENLTVSYIYAVSKWFTWLRRSNGVMQYIKFDDYTSLTGGIDLSDGEWHNIIYVINGTTVNDMHIFIDRIRLNTYVQVNDGVISNGFLEYDIYLGAINYDGGVSDPLQGGLLDEFYLWDRALTSDERDVIYWGGYNNLTFSGTQYQYEPPFISPNMTIQITSVFNDNYYKTNSTCLNNNELYVEWKKTISVDTLEESYGLNHTESQIVYCPYGCTSAFDEFGGGCVKPDWQMYGFIIIIIVIIIMFIFYFKEKK